MTDTFDGLAGQRLGYPCDVEECEYEGATKLALGAHRRHAHGIAGSKAKGRTKARTRAPRAPREAAPSRTTIDEIRGQLEDLAARLEERAPRTAESLRNRSGRIAAASLDVISQAEIGERVIGTVEDEAKAQALKLGMAAGPVALAAFAELVAPRVIGPLVAAFQARRRQRVTDEAGNVFLVDRAGNVFLEDGTPTGHNVNRPPAGPEPAPHAPEPPAPVVEDVVDAEVVEDPPTWPTWAPSETGSPFADQTGF